MTEYIILIPLAILLFGLMPIVARDPYIRKEQKITMLEIISMVCLLVAQNYVSYVLETVIIFPRLRTLVSIVGYIIRPVIIVLFCQLVKPSGKLHAAWGLTIFNAIVYLTAIFSPAVFYIDENNHFHGGILGGHLSQTAYIVSALLLFHLFYCTVTQFRQKRAWIWIAFVNEAIIIVSAILELTPYYITYPVTYVTIATVCCSILFYIWLHLEFVNEHEKALMAEQRIKIMISQIQPHFLYNTLSTIQALCLIDPEKAAHTTENFGAYLRNNIDSLNQPDMIPLEKELEHTKVYTEIEMLRFPKISVEYDIQINGFPVPALSVQPLVENAIRHGVRGNEHGIVEIKTYCKDSDNVIEIRDNGKGFDAENINDLDSDHIGIKNVRERIEKMCGGSVHIDSKKGMGCIVTIKIPRTKE